MRPEFSPLNPGYKSVVRGSFDKQQAMESLGVEIVDFGPGWTEFSLEKRESFTQQHGYLHAGVVAAALDSACGYAALSLMPAEAAVLTVEYKINLMRPADAGRFVVKGWVVKPGRTLTVCQGEAAPESDGRITAAMTATIMTVLDRDIES